MRTMLIVFAALAVSGCVVATTPGPVIPPATPPNGAVPSPRMAVANFVQVVDQVEPVAERYCRTVQPRLDCDFQILVDRDPRSGVNAFHTIDRQGRPLIVYTIGLIAEARNQDELAFVLGHEAGHHIARHLPEREQQAAIGAGVFAEIARRTGGNRSAVGEAARVGGLVAARRYGQQAELEADSIGAVIAYRAGYDPILGASFFNRLPDPAGSFLSTHPPNADRLRTVRRTVMDLQSGRAPQRF